MTWIVTGCAGMIGSAVAGELLDRGEAVVGADLLTPRKGPLLKEWRLDRLRGREGFSFREADVRDPEAVEDLVEGRDVEGILNLAAEAGVRESVEDPLRYHGTNATGTLELLEAARRHDAGTVLLASTSSLYGDRNPTPFGEEARTDRPPSPYAASKKGAEAYAAVYADLHGIDTPTPRYFTVYGPAGRPDMAVFRFVRWIEEGEPLTIYGDGSQERDFTYVDDVARGTVLAREVDGHEVVNLGNDDPVPLLELVETIEEYAGREADLTFQEAHPADMDATWADIGKARELLGWEPKVDLDEGIRRTVAWYEENRDLARRVDLGDV